MTTNNEEWGNISLPGFSDEQLFDKNLNYKMAAKLRNQNPAYINKKGKFAKGQSYVRDLKESDPEAYAQWLEHHRKVTKEAGQTESFRENSRRVGKAKWLDPEKAEQYKQALRDGWNKPGVKENKSRNVQEVLARPGALEAHQERARQNGRKSMKPVVTPEGIFESARSWANHINRDYALFGYRATRQPELYYKISQEEYTKLTGKNI